MAAAWSDTRDFILVSSSPIHGTGIFAKRPIPRGTRVITYQGEKVLKTQLMAEVERGERVLTYVLNLDAAFAIDGARQGNDARFVNHSCQPNCEVYVFEGVPYIYAMEDLPEGIELTFDYRLQSTTTQGISKRLSRELFPCRCGSPACRGTLVALPAPRKRPTSSRRTP
jgi:SET domain-containing protein